MASYLPIPVTCRGQAGWFMVDTGASHNGVDMHVFPDLPVDGEASLETVFSEAAKFTLYQPPHLVVGPFQLDRCGKVLREDYSAVPKYQGKPVLGILGMGAMDCMALQIDFDHRSFRFLPAFGDPTPDWGTAVPLMFERGGTPCVRVSYGKQEDWATVDTGAGVTAHIAAATFDALPDPAMPPGKMEVWTADGKSTVTSKLKRLRAFNFVDGPAFQGVAVERGGSEDSLLGLGLLIRCSKVTIDVAAKRMYIRDRPQAAGPAAGGKVENWFVETENGTRTENGTGPNNVNGEQKR